MVLEIANIQDVKLQKMAVKIDKKGNGNNRVDNDEIGKLLVKMVKNKYNLEDFKTLLGAEFNHISNEEKLNIYQNCHEQLKESMQIAESNVEDGDKIGCCFGKEIIKITGVSALIGGGLKINADAALSLKNISKGALIGSMVGFALSSLACMGDKILYENSKEKCMVKDETLQYLEQEMGQLKQES